MCGQCFMCDMLIKMLKRYQLDEFCVESLRWTVQLLARP